MINKLLSMVFLALPCVFQGIVLEQMLEVKRPWEKRWFRNLIWMVMITSGVCYRVFVNDYEKTKSFTITHGIISFLIFTAIFFKDPIWKKITAIFVLLLGTSLAEILVVLEIQLTGIKNMNEWDFTSVNVVGLNACSSVLSILGIWFILIIWKRIFFHSKSLSHLPLFTIYALFQTHVFQAIPYILKNGKVNYSIYYSILLTMLATVALLFIIFGQARKEVVVTKYEENIQKRQMEASFFENVGNKRKELQIIMNENDLFIHEIEELLGHNQNEKAKEKIMDVLEHLGDTKEYPYCSIPIINVILTEKKKECELQNINLDVEVQIDEDVTIKLLDLCSALNNILDNAIRACKQLEKDKKREIELRVGTSHDYFVIKAKNSYRKNAGKFIGGSGYGLKILKDIAERYRGNLYIDAGEDKYIVQLSLINN